MSPSLYQIKASLYGLLILLSASSDALADKFRSVPFEKVGSIQSIQGPIEVELLYLYGGKHTFIALQFPISEGFASNSSSATVQIEPDQILALMEVLKFACAKIGEPCESPSISRQNRALDPRISDISRQELRDRPVDYWISLLRDPEPAVRHNAAIVIMRAGPEAEILVPTLIESMLNRGKGDGEALLARQAATYALGHAGTSQAVEALVSALEDEHWMIREAGAAALGLAGPRADAAVPALIKALRDPVDSVRESAAEALGAIGTKAQAALPVLKQLNEHQSESVRQAVRNAIKKIEHGEP
jgi:hypothetical protein